ncbi:flagellar basal body P-ring formation chaperone FlgA [Variovorax sp.]|uniref:flagellar basal body P-ring formation chaperone FlgA n=1 Tax=Variovorax sp. TaxID=1871043 RepID=UPI002D742520|nr:flagellar basal body P-ring formation chaperone FlgA [Variovorax sp.]HYP85646.1 flagellar basal body P-ring formation chaperone FlgA [Variovorax sp.]
MNTMELLSNWTFARALRESVPAWLAGVAMAFAMPGSAAPLPDAAHQAIERLVRTQTAGLPGEASVTFRAGPALPDCDADYEAFLPTGSAPWGRVSIGLRCRSSQDPWTRYVAARVTVRGRYFVAARAIAPGEPFRPGDWVERTGDLSMLPRSVVTDESVLQGVTSSQRIAAGAPLRKDLLRGTVVIQQGQTVQVVAQGSGFTISTEGKAMTRAEAGATVQARTRDGRLVTGLADEEGRIQLAQ